MRHNCLEKDIIQGTLSGKRKRGKPKTTWLGNITKWTGMDLEIILGVMDNRSLWRRAIHGAVNRRIKSRVTDGFLLNKSTTAEVKVTRFGA